jgi:hypothetical protein
MATQYRARKRREDTDIPTLLDELRAMAAQGLVGLQFDWEGELRVALGPEAHKDTGASQAVQGASLLERMQALHAAGAEELYA